MARKTIRSTAARPRLPKVDPEVQRWCELLEAELSSWPRVTSRPMFGLSAFYRGGTIFAALPRTRAIDTPYSMLLKLPGVSDTRLHFGSGPGSAWATFAMEDEDDIQQALRWCELAYRKAGARRSAVASGSRAKTKKSVRGA